MRMQAQLSCSIVAHSKTTHTKRLRNGVSMLKYDLHCILVHMDVFVYLCECVCVSVCVCARIPVPFVLSNWEVCIKPRWVMCFNIKWWFFSSFQIDTLKTMATPIKYTPALFRSFITIWSFKWKKKLLALLLVQAFPNNFRIFTAFWCFFPFFNQF